MLADEHVGRQRRQRREHRRDHLPPPASGSDRGGRRGVKQAQLQGNTRVDTTFTVGPLDMLVQIAHAGKTDAVLLEQPLAEHTHHVLRVNEINSSLSSGIIELWFFHWTIFCIFQLSISSQFRLEFWP